MAPKALPPIQRFHKYYTIDPKTGCWVWNRSRNQQGYGQFFDETSPTKIAHRWSHIAFKGPIPAGYIVMHLCDNPPCVNPDHLKAATQKENMQDCLKKGRYEYQKHATHCKYGHEKTGYNVSLETRTYRGITFTQRICRQCKNRNARKSQAKRRMLAQEHERFNGRSKSFL